MIHYQLVCRAEHRFDGWFRDSGTFDRQAQAGLVTCPECGDATVRRALMAPAIGRRRTAPIVAAEPDAVVPVQKAAVPPVQKAAVPPVQKAAALPAEKAGAVLPDTMRALLQRLRAEVENHCEPVGERFAEEARAIHRGEAEERPIYGEATAAEAEALADDGIEVARIPWIRRADG